MEDIFTLILTSVITFFVYEVLRTFIYNQRKFTHADIQQIAFLLYSINMQIRTQSV